MYETFVVPFDKELINGKYEKQKLHMIYQSDAPAPPTPEEMSERKKNDTASIISSLYSLTGESGSTGGTRVNVTPQNVFQRSTNT